MTTATATEARTTQIREYQRSIQTQQVLSVVDGVTTAVHISTSHNKERKQITTFANRVTIRDSSTPGFTVTRSEPMAAVLIGRTPVARYSKGTLIQLHDEALANVDLSRSEGVACVVELFA